MVHDVQENVPSGEGAWDFETAAPFALGTLVVVAASVDNTLAVGTYWDTDNIDKDNFVVADSSSEEDSSYFGTNIVDRIVDKLVADKD